MLEGRVLKLTPRVMRKDREMLNHFSHPNPVLWKEKDFWKKPKVIR